MSLFFFTFSYLTSVALNDKFFTNEVTIDTIANDIAEAEDAIKNALGFDNAFEQDIEAQ